jgi:hypothetical protein
MRVQFHASDGSPRSTPFKPCRQDVSMNFYLGGMRAETQYSVRHIVLKPVELLDSPGVQKLMAEAIKRSPNKIDESQRNRIVIKSISAKQRPRRPASKSK